MSQDPAGKPPSAPMPSACADALSQPADGGDQPRSRARQLAKPLIVAAISLAVGWGIINIVGRIDWAAVGAAFARLEPWQFVPLLVLLGLRQYLNAIPLAKFVPGLRTSDSLRNDLAANLAGTLAPPPGDVVIRVAMFNSWGINPVDGMAGVTLNMVTFYSVRFLAPLAGVALLAIEEVERGQVLMAIGLAGLAIAILGALLLAMRGDRLAAMLGFGAGRVVRRIRQEVDPQLWATAVVDFRARMASTLHRGLPVAMLAMFAMVLADGLILGLSVRFVGVGADVLPAWVILGAFLVAYPLTTLPLFGLGVMDATMVAAWVAVAGLEYEAAILAALVIWRAITLLGPLALGALVTADWKRKLASASNQPA